MTERQRAIRFFQEHGGYSIPPGRMITAKMLADAEQFAKDAGWTYAWEYDGDFEYDLFCCERTDQYADYERARGNPRRAEDIRQNHTHVVEGCVLKNERGQELNSLWSIADANDTRRRVIEAELALEVSSDTRSDEDILDAWLARIAS